MVMCIAAACPGGYRFTTQPPSELDCNPMDRHIPLRCTSGSASDTVTWYWTQTASDAGINGITILQSPQHTVIDFGSTNMKQISFIVSSSTQGYYWCEISNAVNVPLKPSTITPVLLTNKASLPYCTFTHVLSLSNTVPECAAAIEVTTTLLSLNKVLSKHFAANYDLTIDLQKSMRSLSSSGVTTLIASDSVTLPIITLTTTSSHTTTTTTTTTTTSSHTTSIMTTTTTSSNTTTAPTVIITTASIVTITIALIVCAVCVTLIILLMVIIVRFRKRATKRLESIFEADNIACNLKSF